MADERLFRADREEHGPDLSDYMGPAQGEGCTGRGRLVDDRRTRG